MTCSFLFKPEFCITKFQFLGTGEGVSTYDILDFLLSLFFGFLSFDVVVFLLLFCSLTLSFF